MPHLAPILAIVTAVTKAIDIVAPLLQKIFDQPSANYDGVSKSVEQMRKEDINKFLSGLNKDLAKMDEALTKADPQLKDIINVDTNPVDTKEEADRLAKNLAMLVEKIDEGKLPELAGMKDQINTMRKSVEKVAGDMKWVGMTETANPKSAGVYSSTAGQLQPAPGSVVNQSNSQQTIKIS